MKKISMGMLVLVVCFLFSGCDKKPQIDKQAAPAPSAKVEMEKDLMKWLAGGDSVRCQIETEGMKIVVMAKDGKVRTEGMPYSSMSNTQDFDPGNTDGVSLTLGDWVYSWSKRSLEGVKFNMAEMEKMGEAMEEEQEQESDGWEEQVQGWEDDGVEYDCQKVKLSDDLFVEPADVKFVDMADTMKGFGEMGEKFEDGGEMPSMDELRDLLPEGVEVPGME